MEIRGEDFIKKVQLKQEKEEIEQRLTEINNAESTFEETVKNSSLPPKLDREVQIQEEQEYSDIMLGKSPSSNEINKKKYLVLGLILVILFLLTIIIIRLLSNESSSNDSFSKSKESHTEKVLDNENIEEQYQKIINEKLKNIKKEKEEKLEKEEIIDKELNLKKIEEKEIEEVIKESKADVFNVKKKEKLSKNEKKRIYNSQKKKDLTKSTLKKKVSKPVTKITKKTNSDKVITSKPKGTFVQIGAFSKMPSSKYLKGISDKGFKYKIYKISINNKLFHKVLIGPYSSKGQAKLANDDIKKKLNISGAFILTF